MKRVFLYEHLSGAAPAGAAAATVDPLLGEGLAMRDALLADLLRAGGWQVSVAAGGGGELDAPFAAARAVARRPGETVFDFVAREAAAHTLCWVIAPETDGLLARFREQVENTRWLGCDAASIATGSSKRATLQSLAAAGVVTPRAFDETASRRFVVKPDDGAGTLATRQHRSLAVAQADQRGRQAAGLDAVLEPWVDGEPLSLSLLCRARSVELLSVNRQRIDVDADGVVNFIDVQANAFAPDDPRVQQLLAVAQQVVVALPGLRGFVGIDLVWHAQQGPVVIEVNPRVTSAYGGVSQGLRARAGRNVAAEVMAAHLQEHPLD